MDTENYLLTGTWKGRDASVAITPERVSASDPDLEATLETLRLSGEYVRASAPPSPMRATDPRSPRDTVLLLEGLRDWTTGTSYPAAPAVPASLPTDPEVVY